MSIFYVTKKFKFFRNHASKINLNIITNFSNELFFKKTLLYKKSLKKLNLNKSHLNIHFIYLNKLLSFKKFNNYLFEKNKVVVLLLLKLF